MIVGPIFHALAASMVVLSLAILPQALSPALAQTRGLAFYVEESRPLSWQDANGAWRGIAAERVVEMLRRTGQEHSMMILPWRRAYAAALAEQNACVFGAALTEERRPLFKWVSPIAYGGVSFFQRLDDPRKVTSIKDVVDQRMVVGVKSGDITEEVVGAIAGVKAESVAEDMLNVRKLQAGRIDLWAGGARRGHFGRLSRERW